MANNTVAEARNSEYRSRFRGLHATAYTVREAIQTADVHLNMYVCGNCDAAWYGDECIERPLRSGLFCRHCHEQVREYDEADGSWVARRERYEVRRLVASATAHVRAVIREVAAMPKNASPHGALVDHVTGLAEDLAAAIELLPGALGLE